MTVIALVFAGWIGLAAALLGQITTDADAGAFLATWAQAGFAALAAMALVAAARRLRGAAATQTA